MSRRFLRRVTAPTVLITRAYDSGNQTISAAGALTLPHGLGGVPKMVTLWLKCTTGELGYTAGDEVPISVNSDATVSANRGVTAVVSPTTIGVKFGSDATPLILVRNDTGVAAAITNANWALIVRAYR